MIQGIMNEAQVNDKVLVSHVVLCKQDNTERLSKKKRKSQALLGFEPR